MTKEGIKKRIWLFLINKIYVGTKYYEKKRDLMIKLGHEIGENTQIVGPIFCTGKLVVGNNCWIGKNFFVNGNGTVFIGDCCDIAPEVIFQTGGHKIGDGQRRAGIGYNHNIHIGKGCWIGERSTILGGIHVDDGSVVAACACVCSDIEKNVLVGGVPAKVIRKLDKC